jgi:tetratricopeptide (TPR) repeat protein
VAVAFAVIQVLIGGTRLLFGFPGYFVLSVAALVALFTFTRPKPLPSQACFWAAVIFFGYIIGRGLFSPTEYLARSDIYSVMAGLVLYFTVATVLTAATLRMWLVVALLLLALAQVLVGTIQFRYGNNFMPIHALQRFDYGNRASGFYICPDHLAGFLEVAGVMGLSIICWSRWRLWAKLLIAYAVAVTYLGLLLTGSRGGFLSGVASLFVFAVLSGIVLRKSGSSRLFCQAAAGSAIALVLISAGVAWLVHNNEHLASRTNFLDYKNVRLLLWRAALQQWQLNPLFGTGSGTYFYYGRMFRSSQMQGDPVYAHNDYLQLLAEYGVIGAALFLLFLLAHLASGWRNFQRLGPRRVIVSLRLPSNSMALQMGALAAVAAYMVHSVVDFNLHIPANVLLLAFVFGVLANAGQPRREEAPKRFYPWRLVAPVLALLLAVQAVRLLPAEYFTERARVLWNDDKPAEAISYGERALQSEKKNPDLYDYLGSSRTDLADATTNPEKSHALYLAAIDDFERGRALAPLDKTFPVELASVYDTLHRFPEAEWMYGIARALDPKSDATTEAYDAHLKLWSGKAKRAPSPAPSVTPAPNPSTTPAATAPAH